MNDGHAGPAIAEPAWVGDVLRFWFDELSETHWFAKDPDLDAWIRDRFLDLHECLLAQTGADASTPRAALAAVIVLDQFSRNMFRGDPRAYATDPIACRIAKAAIASGFDARLSTPQRMFLYLPLEHSEAIGDQELALRLIETLGNAEWTRYAIAHKTIIERFGRFPHRNAILGRPSTLAEVALLKDPMGSF
ncbi:DUF924 family protein [Dokdonella soli]|uniref:DUF924 family protein n=2 Tax=Dokdonella soli TaxID=529810 RepID=A0ABN1IDC3_9GAMM